MSDINLAEQLLDTWNIHDRINLYLLDAISPDALTAVSASKGRSVGEQFMHIHNVRLMWLKPAAPEFLEGLEKIEKEQAAPSPCCSEKASTMAAKSKASSHTSPPSLAT